MLFLPDRLRTSPSIRHFPWINTISIPFTPREKSDLCKCAKNLFTSSTKYHMLKTELFFDKFYVTALFGDWLRVPQILVTITRNRLRYTVELRFYTYNNNILCNSLFLKQIVRAPLDAIITSLSQQNGGNLSLLLEKVHLHCYTLLRRHSFTAIFMQLYQCAVFGLREGQLKNEVSHCPAPAWLRG